MSLAELDGDIEAMERFMRRSLLELTRKPYDYVAIWNKGQKNEAGYYFVNEDEFYPIGLERFGPDTIVASIEEFDLLQLANILFHIKPVNMHTEKEKARILEQIRNDGHDTFEEEPQTKTHVEYQVTLESYQDSGEIICNEVFQSKQKALEAIRELISEGINDPRDEINLQEIKNGVARRINWNLEVCG